MTSLLTARRRAAEFSAAVDSDSQGNAGYAPGIAELVQVAALLRTHHVITPRAEFASDLRSQLMAEAMATLKPESAKLLLPVRPRSPRERRLVAAASAVVLIGGTASMAAAAESALPGELLYPIKRGIEVADARLNLTPAGEGRALLNQATDRLAEVSGLLANDSATTAVLVPDTLTHFTVQATDGSQLLLDSFEETRDAESVNTVRTFTSTAIITLEQLVDEVPAGAQKELTNAALALREIDKKAESLCSTCGSGESLEIPNIFLARAEVERALDSASTHQLDNSHPVVVRKGVAAPKGEGSKKSEAEEPDVGPDKLPGGVASHDAPPAVTLPTPDSGLLPSGGTDVSANPDKAPVPGGNAIQDNATENTSDDLGGALNTLLPNTDPLP